MQTALHQHAGPAHLYGFANLVVNGVEIENVTLRRKLSLQRTIERAEAAILRAEIRVIDVAIDDVGDNAFRMELAANSIRPPCQARLNRRTRKRPEPAVA